MSWIVKAIYPESSDHDWVYYKSHYGNGVGTNYRQYKCRKCNSYSNIWPLDVRLYLSHPNEENKKMLSCLYRQMRMACE